MNRNYVPYPTEVASFEEAVERSYGNIEALSLGEILIKDTLISKRYCMLFPCRASKRIQKLLLNREEKLWQVLGQNFAEQIMDICLHQKLHQKLSEGELEEISCQFRESLDAAISIIAIPDETIDLSPRLDTTSRMLYMPLTFEQMPKILTDEILVAFDTMISECRQLDNWDFQTPPVDLFYKSLSEKAETYYFNKSDTLLSCLPEIPVNKSIPFSEWGRILSIKWYGVILKHMDTIGELQYKLEPFLLDEITSRALSLEKFFELESSIALEIQTQAKHAYEKGQESKKNKTTSNSKGSSSIPWKRNEESLKALWQVLVDTGSIEDDGYEQFRSNHFAIINQGQNPPRSAFTHKIVWKGNLGNLIRAVQTLKKFGIIGIEPFKYKFGTENQGKINNLIIEHFCKIQDIDFDIASVRKAVQRTNDPDAKIDIRFNNTVLSAIRQLN